MKILVIGDVIHDIFLQCGNLHLAQEGPVLCAEPLSQTSLQGGAALVYQNLKLLTGPGDDIRLLANDELHSTKTRYYDGTHLLFRVNEQNRSSFYKEHQATLEAEFLKHVHEYDTVIIADYAKGTVSDRVLETSHGARRVILDPHPNNIPYKVAVSTYMPNRYEWALDMTPEAACTIVTKDRDGVNYHFGSNRSQSPTRNLSPRTVIGAGGAFCAAYAHCQCMDGGTVPEWVEYALDYVAEAMKSPYHCVPTPKNLEAFKSKYEDDICRF